MKLVNFCLFLLSNLVFALPIGGPFYNSTNISIHNTDFKVQELPSQMSASSKGLSSEPVFKTKGSYLREIIEGVNLHLDSTHDNPKNVPQKKLRDWDTVFMFDSGHYLIHKTRFLRKQYTNAKEIIDTDWDAWVEVKAAVMSQVWSKPIVYDVLKASNGGTISISKGTNFGITLSGNPSIPYSFALWSLTSASYNSGLLFALNAGVQYTLQASCEVPVNGTGALMVFEESEIIQAKIREWSKKLRVGRSKYVPQDWVDQKHKVRSFDKPVFACSTNETYISSLSSRMSKIEDDDGDFSEFLPKTSTFR